MKKKILFMLNLLVMIFLNQLTIIIIIILINNYKNRLFAKIILKIQYQIN